MAVSRYVALKHEFPAELAPELSERSESIRFARWLVQNGLLSDWTIEQSEDVILDPVSIAYAEAA